MRNLFTRFLFPSLFRPILRYAKAFFQQILMCVYSSKNLSPAQYWPDADSRYSLLAFSTEPLLLFDWHITAYSTSCRFCLYTCMWGCMFKYICDEKCDWLRLNGVNAFEYVYVCVYRMTNGMLEVRIFFYLREPYYCWLK